MAIATFDTLKFANTLKNAGVPSEQAEAQAHAFAEVIQLNFKELATKDDLGANGKDLRQEIAALGKELRQEMAAAEQRVMNRVDTLSAQIRGELTLIKWMFGVIVTVGVGILVRLFLFHGPI
jgi:hypothetical protein